MKNNTRLCSICGEPAKFKDINNEELLCHDCKEDRLDEYLDESREMMEHDNFEALK